ncbi:MAG: hypothetical protein ACPGLY_25690 [Rubripirellula sp.]
MRFSKHWLSTQVLPKILNRSQPQIRSLPLGKKDVTKDGELVTHTLELKQGTGESVYEQQWETTNATNTLIARSEAKLRIERAGKRKLAYNYKESRRLRSNVKSHD